MLYQGETLVAWVRNVAVRPAGEGLDLPCPPLLPCQPHSACTEKASKMHLRYEQKAGPV